MARINLPQKVGGQFQLPKSLGTPGYAPNYQQAILSDPLYRQTSANLSAGDIAAGADRDQGLQSALVNFGAVPDLNNAATGLGLDPNSALAKALQGVINPQVAGAAQGNPFSTEATLGQAHDKALGGIMDNLGARGGFQQGAYGSAATAENQNYGQQQYGAHQSLLSYLTGIQQAFAQHQATSQNSLATAAQDATARQIQLNPTTPGTGLYAGLTPHALIPYLNIPARPTAQAAQFATPPAFSHGGAA